MQAPQKAKPVKKLLVVLNPMFMASFSLHVYTSLFNLYVQYVVMMQLTAEIIRYRVGDVNGLAYMSGLYI